MTEAIGAFSVANAAAYLSISRASIYLLIKDGSLPKVKVGHRTLIRRVDADAFLERSLVGTPAAPHRATDLVARGIFA